MAVVIEEFESKALVGNPLGDPGRRKIPVYLPPSYNQHPERRYPVVYMLHGFTGNSAGWLNVNPFYTPTVPERFERLVTEGRCGEMILVFPDGSCGLGGSQYLNSAATGQYEDYIVQDLIPYIDAKFRTLARPDGRGVAGKSSGGFGAVRLAMLHPETFGAFASHAGDMYFEYCYLPDFPKAVNSLVRFQHNPNPAGAFLAAFEETEQKGPMIPTLNILAMAACYSPVEGEAPLQHPTVECSFYLPFDMHTGELRQDVWERWLTFDPVRMLDWPQNIAALERMRGCYLDGGLRDEYNLHLGARIFAHKATAKGIKIHHEEFDDGHMGINYRYDVSLPFLCKALEQATA